VPSTNAMLVVNNHTTFEQTIDFKLEHREPSVYGRSNDLE
jgi:hypothetical protein